MIGERIGSIETLVGLPLLAGSFSSTSCDGDEANDETGSGVRRARASDATSLEGKNRIQPAGLQIGRIANDDSDFQVLELKRVEMIHSIM
jgi:hypothetical protein